MNQPLSILRPGDTVGFVAPGSTFSKEKFEQGEAFVKSLGLKVVHGPHLFDRDFIFAGTVTQRVQSLKKMLARKDIKALWCVRGGSGSYAVAQELASLPKPKYSKVIFGMSDITALHLLATQKWKWPALHGPLLDRIGTEAANFVERESAVHTLFDADYRLKSAEGLVSIGHKKAAVGVVTGGNLALLTTSLGSKWEWQTKNKILFIEDVGEKAYRIERMLTQLKSAGKFENIRGIIFGDFTDCIEADKRELWQEVLERHFKGAAFPVVRGLQSGHGDLRLTLPFGVKAELKGGLKPSFEILEGYARA